MNTKNSNFLTPEFPTRKQSRRRFTIRTEAKDEKPTKEGTVTEVLTPQAERFRTRLIRDFRLLDNLNEDEYRAPKYHPSDIQDSTKLKKILADNPNALVKFSPIKKAQRTVTKQERRWKRLKYRETKYPPLDLWANWVVESNWFQNFMLVLIVCNAVLLVVDAEISDTRVLSNHIWIRVIRTCDYCCLWIFILEIILKWVDDFKSFWTNVWNELDFYITLISILPEIIKLFDADFGSGRGEVVSSLGFLRVLRITRLLKMVSRFEQARIILLAVTKAFSAMSFILLLLGLFMWIFAIMGGVLFDKYTKFDGRAAGVQLSYQTAFSDTLWAFATLFQLMTLDHWLQTLMDLLLVMKDPYESTMTITYILAWIWVGSFVFKNIFAGIMVNNFQTIQNDLHWEQKEREAKKEVDKFKMEFQEELENQAPDLDEHSETGVQDKDLDIISRGQPGSSRDEESEAEVPEDARSLTTNLEDVTLLTVPHQIERTQSIRSNESAIESKIASSILRKKSIVSLMSHLSNNSIITDNKNAPYEGIDSEEAIFRARWDQCIQCHMDATQNLPNETIWPRDTLFKFYNTMEKLQENLQERQDILKMTSHALLQIHDR